MPTMRDERIHVAIAVYVGKRQPRTQVLLGTEHEPVRPPKRPLLRREGARARPAAPPLAATIADATPSSASELPRDTMQWKPSRESRWMTSPHDSTGRRL